MCALKNNALCNCECGENSAVKNVKLNESANLSRARIESKTRFKEKKKKESANRPARRKKVAKQDFVVWRKGSETREIRILRNS